MCVLQKNPSEIIAYEKDPPRTAFVYKHFPNVLTGIPEDCKIFTAAGSDHGGANAGYMHKKLPGHWGAFIGNLCKLPIAIVR